MGLREVKVARTRAQIVDVALDLFVEQGYEATTMEEIAVRAEVGSSTLYRYFPSKELLVLDPLVRALDFARLLRDRPEDEPLGAALGAVIRASYPAGELDVERFVALRAVVDGAPAPRARLWDLAQSAVSDLELAIAERLGRSVGDLGVSLTAGTAYAVYQRAGNAWRGRTRVSWERAVDRTLEAVADVDIVVPAP
jgi:AcrR family transcriptional regulator